MNYELIFGLVGVHAIVLTKVFQEEENNPFSPLLMMILYVQSCLTQFILFFRQLVIEYVRYRAAVGSKFQRTCWAAVPNLPVAPSTCAKRMSSLKRNAKFREAVMKLCNLLSERFVNHHKQAGSMLPNYDGGKLLQFPRKENCNEIVSNGAAQGSDLEGKRWDDFNDEDIKRALEDALQLKRIAKLETSKRVGSVSRNWSNVKQFAIMFLYMLYMH